MSIFSDLPIRSNADVGKVDATWFNRIRTAILTFAGTGALDETQFTIADNQTAYQSITGLFLDASVTRAADVEYTLYRTDGTASSIERRERGVLRCFYKALDGSWSYERESWGDDALNKTTSLILDGSGQGHYLSDSVGGTYTGSVRFKTVLTFDLES